VAIGITDIFILDTDYIESEEFISIPDTGINGFTRPILYTALDDPREIINVDAGNLRVDSAANIVGNVSSGSRTLPKNFLGISAHSFTGERSAISDSLGGIEDYTNVGSFTTSVYNPSESTHIGFGTYGNFGNSLATNANGSLLIVGNKTSIIDGYFVGIGTTVGIATYYGSAYLYERISNNFIKRDCIVGEYSKPGTGATHIGDDYGYSVAMSLDGKTFAVGGPNVIGQSKTVGVGTTAKTGVVWVYDYKPPVDPEFCGIGSLKTCCGIGTSTFCDVLKSNLLETSSLSACGIGSTNICRTKNVDKLAVLQGDSDGDLFGQALAISADAKVIVVGAPGIKCTPLSYNGGGVYVYDRNDNKYEKVGILTGPSTGTFGSSVSVNGDGNIIVVGDPTSGKSYVYERDDKRYGFFLKIGTLSSGGTQVCVSDDGATVITSNGSNSTVFDRSGSTFTSVGSLTGGSVGISCSPDGKVITTASGSGYYVYNREGDTFYLNVSEAATLDSFDMSTNTKVIYRGNSSEVVGSGRIGKVYCDDQSLETFVYSDENGNIGVATSQPLARFHVTGNSRFTGSVYVTGIVTAAYFVGDGSGLYNVGDGYSTLFNGIDTAGISTFSDLYVSNDLVVGGDANVAGIITASSFVSSGTTAVYTGINTSTVDSNTTSFHYITFNTSNSGVNVSNFTSGKKFEIVARNNAAGSRTLVVGTSNTSAGFTTVPRIVHSGGEITNGTITINSNSGLLISIFNMGGTVIASY
jgi:hypothetical protein